MSHALRLCLLCWLIWGSLGGVCTLRGQTADLSPDVAPNGGSLGAFPLQPPSPAQSAARLPAGFRSLSTAELRLLDGLTSRAMAWILEVPAAETPAAAVANFFGALDSSSDSLYDAKTHRADEFGPFVMRALTRNQKDSLANLLIQQRDVLQEYVKLRNELSQKVHEIRGETSQPRAFDFQIVKLAREIGREEASIALVQAKGFCDLQAMLSADQREYLRLVRVNPDVINPDTPEMAETKKLFEQMNESDQQWLKLLCVKCTTFITGSLDENSQSLRNDFRGLLPCQVNQNPKRVSRQTSNFLKTLSVAQQKKLYELLKAEVSLVKAYFSHRYYMETTLDGIKRSKMASEQKLRQAGAEMTEVEAKIALMEARTFEEIRTSLSTAQRLFIKQNWTD